MQVVFRGCLHVKFHPGMKSFLSMVKCLFLFNCFCRDKNSSRDEKKTPKHLPAGNYLFRVNNRNIRTRCKLCSKLTIKIPIWHLRENQQNRCSIRYVASFLKVLFLSKDRNNPTGNGVNGVLLVSLLLTLNIF